jgi:fructose-1,6-bisphosphatase/inositol monophosphatase family enzyme
LYKKGDKINISNYRPVSLLTSFSKVFEKVMYARLMEHLKTNKIFAEEQFGFKKNLATEEVIYKLTYAILRD